MNWEQIEKEQLAELEKLNLRHKIYYQREKDGSVACAVILMEGIDWISSNPTRLILARGISYCNPLDTFSKVHARVVARGRAMRAIKRRNSSSVIKHRLLGNFAFVKTMFNYKSEFRPEPSLFEEKLLKEKEKENA